MNIKEIANKIREDYRKVNSLAVNYRDGDEVIEIVGMMYEGKEENFASEAQIKFLLALNNIEQVSDALSLRKTNKWFLSACIQIAKEYPDQPFIIEV